MRANVFSRVVELGAAMVLGGCGATATQPAASSAPRAYAGRCDLVGIEEVPAPSEQEVDAILVIAKYSPGSTNGADSPLAFRFQIARARVNDLRTHLQAHPSIVCEPDQGSPRSGAAPSFEGQRGQPVGDGPSPPP